MEPRPDAHVDPGVYRLIWWAFGHSSQQINVATHVSIWYLTAAVLFGAKPLSEKVSRFAFFLYIAVLQIASAHHLLVDPGLSSEWKIFNTSYAMYLAVMASMVHGLTVPGSIEAAQRAHGLNSGLFEWLRKAPWGNPVFSAMFLSLVGFGVLGGITGVVMGTEQINLVIHNTVYVPGHFHGTVVVGTTLAFMAITYWLVPMLFRRDLILKGVASWQPYVFGLGMTGVALFLMGAGTLGVPRRHWDILFSRRRRRSGYEFSPAALTMMSLNGMSVVLAGLGGAIYIVVVVGSILFGRKLGENEKLGVEMMQGAAGGREVPRHRHRFDHDPRHAGDGRRVLRGLRAVLLHQLEVPGPDLGSELRDCRRPGELVSSPDGPCTTRLRTASLACMTHREIIDIFKLRIGALMALTAVAGYVVTPGIRLSSLQLLLLALVVLGASAAAGAFNQFAEHDLDAKMTRTAKRAFVTGAATPDNRWLALIGALLLVSVALGGWAFNLAVAFHAFMGAFVYGVVYTLWLKRRTPLNIVIGGAAGSFAVLAGAAARTPVSAPSRRCWPWYCSCGRRHISGRWRSCCTTTMPAPECRCCRW